MQKLRSVQATTLLLLAGFLSSATVWGAEKVDLRLLLRTGKTYKLRMVSDNLIKSTVRGQERQTNKKMSFTMGFTVEKKSPDGDFTIKVAFERVQVALEGLAASGSYDSAEPGGDHKNPLIAGFSVLAGQSYTVVINERGKVKKLSGMKEILERMVENIHDNEQTKKIMQWTFEQMFCEGGTMELAGKMFGMLPPRHVEIGESWSRTDSIKAHSGLKMEQNWTLESLNDSVAVVRNDSRITSDPEAPASEMGPIKMKFNLRGAQTGTVELYRDSGWIVGGSMTKRVSGEQIILEGQTDSGGMSIPISVETKTTFQSL